jgi:hypothetical protein
MNLFPTSSISDQAMRIFTSVILATFFGLSSPLVQADFVNLYNGTGLPGNQPWLSFASDGILSGGTATQSTVAGGARLQTDLAVSAGYSNYTPFSALKNGAFPVLNRNVGFELNFSLMISTESHSNNNRAGFSAILLGSDQQGIELGFWTNEIWAQSSSPLFQHAEGVAIDTTISRNYRIQILNNAYTLLEGSNSLLSGNLRDYSSFGAPYSLPSFLFLGDNTSSGRADITLGAVSLQSDLSVVPEPSSILLLAGGIVVAMMYVFGLDVLIRNSLVRVAT